MYASYVLPLGWAGSNSVIFGEYILNAARIGLACVKTAFLIRELP
jgi:hypothetical protein